MRVWVDQDLCTGDGLCTDHCPDVFMLLEDGMSYVRDATGRPSNDPGGRASIVVVPARFVNQTITAALDCPGECIFLENDRDDDRDDDDSDDDDRDEADIIDANVVDG